MSYLETTHRVYRAAAAAVQPALCCTTAPRFRLPDLSIPKAMEEMNYGCGTTVHLQPRARSPALRGRGGSPS
jgi:hypothetical protein